MSTPIAPAAPGFAAPTEGYELKQNYGDSNARPYLVRLGLTQEAIRDRKLDLSNKELNRLRNQVDDITAFNTEVQEQLQKGDTVDLTGKNQLTDRLYEVVQDERLKKTTLTRTEAEILCYQLTRRCENHITPDIEDTVNDMTHIIEDLDKILPLLKELMQAYDELIKRINNRQK